MEYNDEKTISTESQWEKMESEYLKENKRLVELDDELLGKLSKLIKDLEKVSHNSSSLLGLKASLSNYPLILPEVNSGFFSTPISIITQNIFEILNKLFSIYSTSNDKNKKGLYYILKSLIEVGVDINKNKRKW